MYIRVYYIYVCVCAVHVEYDLFGKLSEHTSKTVEREKCSMKSGSIMYVYNGVVSKEKALENIESIAEKSPRNELLREMIIISFLYDLYINIYNNARIYIYILYRTSHRDTANVMTFVSFKMFKFLSFFIYNNY